MMSQLQEIFLMNDTHKMSLLQYLTDLNWMSWNVTPVSDSLNCKNVTADHSENLFFLETFFPQLFCVTLTLYSCWIVMQECYFSLRFITLGFTIDQYYTIFYL